MVSSSSSSWGNIVRKEILVFLVICIVMMTACNTEKSTEKSVGVNNMQNPKDSLIIRSPAFSDNTLMPRKYSCQGDDVNPPLEFSNIPKAAQSLVLIMEDPDAPMGTWDHWILFNMPVISKIIEDSVPEGAMQASNSWGNNTYGGPCPPAGTHRYIFKLYALDMMLHLDENANKRDVEIAMQGHVLSSGQLIGLYKKS
jgi:hypothetical protein